MAYPSGDAAFFAKLPCAVCTASEPQYERGRVSDVGQFERPNNGTWPVEKQRVELPSELGAELGHYLMLPREDRREYRAIGEGVYGRFAAVFSCKQEDFLAARWQCEGSDSDLARELGVSRQAVSKRLKWTARRLEHWRNKVVR